jgi:hypothetical protein
MEVDTNRQLCFDELRTLVLDEGKNVSYKSLALHLQIDCDQIKRFMQQFMEQEHTGAALRPLYYMSGLSAKGAYRMTICDAQEAEKLQQTLSRVTGKHLYSLGPAPADAAAVGDAKGRALDKAARLNECCAADNDENKTLLRSFGADGGSQDGALVPEGMFQSCIVAKGIARVVKQGVKYVIDKPVHIKNTVSTFGNSKKKKKTKSSSKQTKAAAAAMFTKESKPKPAADEEKEQKTPGGDSSKPKKSKSIGGLKIKKSSSSNIKDMFAKAAKAEESKSELRDAVQKLNAEEESDGEAEGDTQKEEEMDLDEAIAANAAAERAESAAAAEGDDAADAAAPSAAKKQKVSKTKAKPKKPKKMSKKKQKLKEAKAAEKAAAKAEKKAAKEAAKSAKNKKKRKAALISSDDEEEEDGEDSDPYVERELADLPTAYEDRIIERTGMDRFLDDGAASKHKANDYHAQRVEKKMETFMTENGVFMTRTVEVVVQTPENAAFEKVPVAKQTTLAAKATKKGYSARVCVCVCARVYVIHRHKVTSHLICECFLLNTLYVCVTSTPVKKRKKPELLADSSDEEEGDGKQNKRQKVEASLSELESDSEDSDATAKEKKKRKRVLKNAKALAVCIYMYTRTCVCVCAYAALLCIICMCVFYVGQG